MAKFWPRWIADLHAKTLELSLEHRGAYDALLDYYYMRGGALPLEHEALYRVVRAANQRERAAIDAMLARFFTRTDQGYMHPRCELELAKMQARSDAQSRRGRMGAGARWKGNGSAPLTDDSPIVETLPLIDASEYMVTEQFAAELEPLYPLVDVRGSLREMKGWLIGNPTRRKTARGIRKFVTAWLARENERYTREQQEATQQ